EPKRFAREAKTSDAPRLRFVHENAENDRMQVQMQMAIDVVERQSRGCEARELSANFGAELFAQTALEKVANTDAHRIVIELPVRVHQAGNLLLRQRGTAAQQREVQADA